ncbi:ABC transporter [Gordoniibacillus kamchatkensis]|uniref:ABC transporter n=1 Tax=Gordoniibacillus kamchatkensis TaxID=1590651 RepID=A0ABR5AL90_9BACL|nr:ABC transporter [Paenibacillus sp. VKM B-2647]
MSGSYQTTPAERKAAFRHIVAYAKPHLGTFLLVFGCSLVAILADLLQPYLVKIAIDDHLMGGKADAKLLWMIGATYAGLALLSLLFTYWQNNLLQRIGQSIVAKLRKDLFRHIQSLSMSFFDRFPIGSLVTHESSDTESISQFFTQVLLSLIRDGMTLIFILIFMFKLDVKLALISATLLPVIAIIAVVFRSWLRQTYQAARTQLSRMIAFLAENLAGMSLIQAFNQEEEQFKQFEARNQRYWKANVKEIRSNVLFNRSFDILGNVSVALLTWIGGMAVFHRELEFGVLYAFINYIRQFFQPINAITQQWNTMQSATVSMDRLWRIFSTKPEVVDPEPEQAVDPKLEDVRGAIAYRGVEFGYLEGTRVINRLDLSIRPGEMIGIVGVTGAGKSSLMSLLCRFYDVTAGAIEIDGIDVRRIPQAKLHRMIGLVQQEPYLYSGSIIDNVRMFDERYTRGQVIEACRFVGADPLIRRLKDGYDTLLSERGSGLSAGERQLLSFARIVLLEPRILILDEATANLDSFTEQLVQHALQVVSAGRTTLVIAHRLSTVMHADRIIVMKHGDIVEQGTHAELIEQGGYYKELYEHAKGGHGLEELQTG